jgi:hypothetical protein
MLILAIILLAFPIGLVLVGLYERKFGRKYEDLTEEEKKRCDEIERENEKQMKRLRNLKPKGYSIPCGIPYY